MKNFFLGLSAAVFSILLFSGCPQTTTPEPVVVTPVELKAVTYDGMVRVYWDPMVNAKSYVLYRNGKYLATKEVSEYRAATTGSNDLAFYDWIAEDSEYKNGDTVEYVVLAINRSDPATADLAGMYKEANSKSKIAVTVSIPERGTNWKKPSITSVEFVRGSYDTLPATGDTDFIEVGFNKAFDSSYTVKVFSGASELIKDPLNMSALYSYQLGSTSAAYGRVRFPAVGGPVTVYLISNYDGTTPAMYYASVSEPVSKEIPLISSAGLALAASPLADGKVRISWRNMGGQFQYKLYRALNGQTIATADQTIAGDFIRIDTSAAVTTVDGYYMLDYTPESAASSFSFVMVLDNGTAKSLPVVVKLNDVLTTATILNITKNYNSNDTSVLLNWEYNPNATYTLTRARLDNTSYYSAGGVLTTTNTRIINADGPAYQAVTGSQNVVDIGGKKWVRVEDTVDNRFAGYIYQLKAEYGTIAASYVFSTMQNLSVGTPVLNRSSGPDRESGKQVLSWIGLQGVNYELARAVYTDVYPGSGTSLEGTFPLDYTVIASLTGDRDGREHRYEDTIAEADRNKKFLYRLTAKTGNITTTSNFVEADYSIPMAGTLTAAVTKDFDTTVSPTRPATVSLEWGAEVGVTYKLSRVQLTSADFPYIYNQAGAVISANVFDSTTGALKLHPTFTELPVVTPIIIENAGSTYARMADTNVINQYGGAYLYKVVSVNGGVEGKPVYALVKDGSFVVKKVWIDYTATPTVSLATNKLQFTITVKSSYPLTSSLDSTVKAAVTNSIELYYRPVSSTDSLGNYQKLSFLDTDMTVSSDAAKVVHTVQLTTRDELSAGTYRAAYKEDKSSSSIATEIATDITIP